MKLPLQKIAAAALLFLLVAALLPIGIAMEWGSRSNTVLPGWELKWERTEADEDHSPAAVPSVPEEGWMHVQAHEHRPAAPAGVSAAWLRISLPPTDHSALLIDKVYGSEIKVFQNNVLIYNTQGNPDSNGSKVLIPLSGKDQGSQLYVWSGGGNDGFGIEGEIQMGSYSKLLISYMSQGLLDLVIGGTLVFMAIILLFCSFFLKRELFSGGFLLVLVILSIGVLVITYSSFLPLIMTGYGKAVETVFDLALLTLLPSFTFYFEKIFGSGRNAVITRIRKFQISYSVFCVVLLVLNILFFYRLESLYRYMTLNVIGVMMLLQFMYLLGLAVLYAYKGNRDAVIFSTGFAVFAILSLTELILYYTSEGRYQLYWWKWGMIVFVIALIIILGRKFTKNHEQIVEYSRELEKFNNDLQRSEKMEIISELAASVAHEVRNPLQVTRGFLQILGERSSEKEQEYLRMAVSELDRAALIITDFLTFAKPGLETVDLLEVGEELKHVSGILMPLANLHGGTIEIKIQAELKVLGCSSKFKQAFINILKNSVEALQDNGLIIVTAWRSGEHIIISVRDNGEGMKVSDLARLGEPYYSNKTKGTGLGLMVTFRIIEAMGGTIQFQSKKGEGTEVIIKLPVAKEQ